LARWLAGWHCWLVAACLAAAWLLTGWLAGWLAGWQQPESKQNIMFAVPSQPQK
jgi:type II secretory pathway component PulL